MVIIEGMSATAEGIFKLKDKTFTIKEKPTYKEIPNIDNPEKKDKKLILRVELSDKSLLDYYPNKTSQKAMVGKSGYEMDNWVNKTFEWKIVEQSVRGELKKVLFIK